MCIRDSIEGTRSRTGKLLPPKYGILKYMMTALRENRTSDILLCPVSLQYDSVIEAESYVDELLGKPKQSESLYGLVTGGSAILQLKMGRIDVRFKKPWSMREFLDQEEKLRLGAASNDGTRAKKVDVIRYVLDTADPQRPLMVGDRLHDFEGAKEFGIPSVAMTWGYGADQEWELANYVARDADELERIIREF